MIEISRGLLLGFERFVVNNIIFSLKFLCAGRVYGC